eukprot:SAG31_NODE_1363_length_8627_cov_5.967402_7_plen_197_part_00
MLHTTTALGVANDDDDDVLIGEDDSGGQCSDDYSVTGSTIASSESRGGTRDHALRCSNGSSLACYGTEEDASADGYFASGSGGAGYTGVAAFQARLAGMERNFTPPLSGPAYGVDGSHPAHSTSSDGQLQQQRNGVKFGGSAPYDADLDETRAEGSTAINSETSNNATGDIDLLYDPILSCYFDPKTNRYYELKTT